MTAGVPIARELPATRLERFFIIVNVRAGGVRRRPAYVDELTRAVGRRGRVFATSDARQLTDAVAQAHAEGADAIGICGGDGSNVRAFTEIAHQWGDTPWPMVALLPAGTLNTAATNLAIPRGRPAQLVAGLMALDEPNIQSRALVRVNELVGFIFGAQMVARVLDEYYAGRTGPLGAAWLAARMTTSAAVGGALARRMFTPDEVRLSVEGGPWQTRSLTALLASTVAAPAVKLRAMPRAGENGCFQLVGAECSPLKFVPDLGRLFAGLPVSGLTLDVVAREAKLKLGQHARFTVDGDLFEGSEVTLQATPPVRLLVP